MKKDLKSLKEKFGKFALTQEQIKIIRGAGCCEIGCEIACGDRPPEDCLGGCEIACLMSITF